MGVSFWYNAAYLLAACSLLYGGPADTTYRIRTVAGTDFNGDGRPATDAILVQPEGIAIDAQGNLYIADAGDNRVRKIDTSGRISTIAGTGYAGPSGLNAPYDVCIDAAGNIYIADLGNARIRKIARDGTITTVAGAGALDQLVQPRNIAVDSRGTLYISDFGAHRIYQLTAEGKLILFAGTGEAGTSEDSVAATLAKLSSPAGLAFDASGNLYVADSGNRRVRRISAGQITTVRDTNGIPVEFATPTSVAVDRLGDLYVADGSSIVTRIRAGITGFMRIAARTVAIDASGRLFVAVGRQVQRFDNPSAVIIAGRESSAFAGDGKPAAEWRFSNPSSVVRDASGNIYIADSGNGRIRQISPSGELTTLIGGMTRPVAMTFDASGVLYIADSATGTIHRYERGNLGVFSKGSESKPFLRPSALVFDKAGNLFVADTGNNLIRKISPAGAVTTVAGGGGLLNDRDPLRVRVADPAGLALDPSGNVWFTEAGSGLVRKLSASGELTTLKLDLKEPRGLKIDEAGDLYISDAAAHRIIRSTPEGEWWPIAGSGETGTSDIEGPAMESPLIAPVEVWLDAGERILIADAGAGRIRELIPGAQSTPPPGELQTGDLLVLHAATLQSQDIAPGQLVLIRGNNLIEEGHTLPTETEITVGGAPAVILSVAKNEILAQMPLALPTGLSQLKLKHRGIERSETALRVSPVAPGLFTASNGSGQVLALNENGTRNSLENPAPRSSVISLYGTGAGSGPLDISAYFDGFLGGVEYAGPAPGQPGLFQINVRTPGFAPTGVQTLVLVINGIRSQAGVTVVTR